MPRTALRSWDCGMSFSLAEVSHSTKDIEQWHSDGTEILNDIAPPQPAEEPALFALAFMRKQGQRAISSGTHSGFSTRPQP